MEPLVKNGIYKHYNNGKLYRLIGLSTNPNDHEDVIVVYRPVRSPKLHHKHKEEFFSNVMKGGKVIPKYKLEEKVKP